MTPASSVQPMPVGVGSWFLIVPEEKGTLTAEFIEKSAQSGIAADSNIDISLIGRQSL